MKTEECFDKDDLLNVIDYSDIMGENLANRTRIRDVVWSRYAVWYYLIEMCHAKLSDVARLFNVHHTTIVYAMKQVNQKLEVGDYVALFFVEQILEADPHKVIQK